MSYLPKASPHAREEVIARMNSYNKCWKISINSWRECNGCIITPWHESLYNEAELCRKLHCAEDKGKSLIKSNPVIFTGCYFFYSHLHDPWMVFLCKRRMEILALWIQMNTAVMSIQLKYWWGIVDLWDIHSC